MSAAGELLRIWSKRVHRGPMDALETAYLEPGGLRGDASFGRRFRQVTLLQKELWEEVEGDLGAPVDPVLRRANLLLRDLDLADSRGKILRIGPCRLHIRGETRPCRFMDEQYPGLRAALHPPWRGGAYAEVLDGGEIRRGDPVSWEDEGNP